MDNNMDNNMNNNEFYALYLKTKNDGNYLESLTPAVLRQTQRPEEAKRFKTIFDAKNFFFDNMTAAIILTAIDKRIMIRKPWVVKENGIPFAFRFIP